MQTRSFCSGRTSSVVLVAFLAGCGGDASTIPTTESTPIDLDADRIEIVFAYSPGDLSVPTTMDLFQSTREGRLTAPVIATSDMEHDPEWSRDGSRMTLTQTTPNQANVASIWIANADGSGLRKLVVDPTPPAGFFNYQWGGTWSPDGDSIAFHRSIGNTEDGLAVINADGTGLRWVLQDMNVGRPSWSVNGLIAFSNGGFIWTIRPDGSGLTRVTTSGGDAAPRWSRDGSHLAFVQRVGNANNPAYDIVTTRPDGSGRRTVATGGNNIDPSWSPDGLYILFDHPEFTAESGWICTLRKVPSTRGTVVNLTPDRGAGTCGGAAWRPF
jgi:hypothetical protein